MVDGNGVPCYRHENKVTGCYLEGYAGGRVVAAAEGKGEIDWWIVGKDKDLFSDLGYVGTDRMSIYPDSNFKTKAGP